MTISLSFSMLLHLDSYMNVCYKLLLRIPVAARSNGWVCGRSLPGIVDSNLAGGMDVSLLWMLCAVK